MSRLTWRMTAVKSWGKSGWVSLFSLRKSQSSYRLEIGDFPILCSKPEQHRNRSNFSSLPLPFPWSSCVYIVVFIFLYPFSHKKVDGSRGVVNGKSNSFLQQKSIRTWLSHSANECWRGKSSFQLFIKATGYVEAGDAVWENRSIDSRRAIGERSRYAFQVFAVESLESEPRSEHNSWFELPLNSSPSHPLVLRLCLLSSTSGLKSFWT